jgi:hypothetical protein
MTGNALYLFVREGVAKDIEPKPRGLAYNAPAPLPSPDEEAMIVIGAEGGDKVFPYWFYQSISVEEKTFTEYKREVSQKRVENPDDPSQYVMVEQIDKLYMKDKFTLAKERWELSNKRTKSGGGS